MISIGVYSNGIIKTKANFRENQKVLIIPFRAKKVSTVSAFGGLHKYANKNLNFPESKECQ